MQLKVPCNKADMSICMVAYTLLHYSTLASVRLHSWMIRMLRSPAMYTMVPSTNPFITTCSEGSEDKARVHWGTSDFPGSVKC